MAKKINDWAQNPEVALWFPCENTYPRSSLSGDDASQPPLHSLVILSSYPQPHPHSTKTTNYSSTNRSLLSLKRLHTISNRTNDTAPDLAPALAQSSGRTTNRKSLRFRHQDVMSSTSLLPLWLNPSIQNGLLLRLRFVISKIYPGAAFPLPQYSSCNMATVRLVMTRSLQLQADERMQVVKVFLALSFPTTVTFHKTSTSN